MDERLTEALEQPLAKSRVAAKVTKRRRLTEEAAIQAAWEWHVHNRDAEVPFSEIVTRIQACCAAGITSARIRAAFERRRRSTSE